MMTSLQVSLSVSLTVKRDVGHVGNELHSPLAYNKPVRCLPPSPDMRSFIPEEDRAFFEAFLIENHLPVDQSGGGSARTVPSPAADLDGGRGAGKRGRKGRSHRAHIADVDKFLADIDSHAESMMNSTNFLNS